MKQANTYRDKITQMIVVLLPIFVTQITLMSTGFFDTVMAGNVSGEDLAGVAVGVNLFFPVFGSTLGVISGLTPIIAQLYGAGKRSEIPYIVLQGVYLAAAIGVTILLLGWLAAPFVIAWMGLEPKVAYVAKWFLAAIACGLCPIFVSGALRNFIDALGYTRVTMLVTMCAVPINIFLNYLFIFGKFGFPQLGGIGAGIGTGLTHWLIMCINVAVVTRVQPFKEYQIFSKWYAPSFKAWRSHLALGLPIGSAMFCEQSIFGAVGLFMAAYGTTVIAAHQAALNFTTMIYMIPLSISMTLTILVGFEVGAGRPIDARRYSYLGIALSVLFSGSLTIFLAGFRDVIAAMYTNDSHVFALVEVFLLYAIFLQLSDALSAPMQGALRGYKDVRVTLILAILSYWVIGLPVGYAFANLWGFGPYGYWLGLIAGIAVGAVFLGMRLWKVQHRYFKAQRLGEE